MPYPANKRSAFARQLEAEAILEELAQATLEEWAQFAPDAYAMGLSTYAVPLTAAGNTGNDPRAWWGKLWEHVFNYGAGLLYGDTMQRAAGALGIEFPAPVPGAVVDAPAPVNADGVDTDRLHKRAAVIVTRGLGKEPDRSPNFTIRQAQARYLAEASSRYANVPDAIFRSVTKDIDEGLAKGESPDQDMRRRVEQTLSKHLDKDELAKTARMIARTESAAAQSRATLDVAKVNTSTGTSDLEKAWVATHDNVTRKTHREADRQRVPINGKFRLGRFEIDHPGDGPPSEARNCRCAVMILRTHELLPT